MGLDGLRGKGKGGEASRDLVNRVPGGAGAGGCAVWVAAAELPGLSELQESFVSFDASSETCPLPNQPEQRWALLSVCTPFLIEAFILRILARLALLRIPSDVLTRF